MKRSVDVHPVRAAGFALLAAVGLTVSPAAGEGIRAALDYTFVALEGARSSEVTCDFCGHKFHGGTIQFVPVAVNAAAGTVDMYFFKTEGDSLRLHEEAQRRPARSSDDPVLEADCLTLVRVRKGQTVRLRETDVSVRIVDVFGRGCPPGSNC